jgi:phospholipid/cholesterol/gamma-HCH transport system ATP-binding protein
MTNPVEIRVEGLYKGFRGHAVLVGIDLEIPRGDLVAIVGASGCGKTVLLHHIIAHLKPDRGRVLVADHEQEGAPLVDIAKLDEEGLDRIRLHSAVVFQRNALFSATVYENIALWLREIKRMEEDAILVRAREALDAVGFKGDESVLWKDRAELSGGMAKRVALARALAMRPYTIFFDEPTTGLDPITTDVLVRVIEEMRKRLNPTAITITHDLKVAFAIADRVGLLAHGKIEIEMTPKEFEASADPRVAAFVKGDSELSPPELEPERRLEVSPAAAPPV